MSLGDSIPKSFDGWRFTTVWSVLISAVVLKQMYTPFMSLYSCSIRVKIILY